jgi:hypothetical protein
MESPEAVQNKLGLSCFIAILCQCRSAFSFDFSKIVLDKISRLFEQSDSELFVMCLHIAVHISGTTLEQTRLVQRLIPMSTLIDFIMQQRVAPAVVHKALFLFGNYCRASDTISGELADVICRVISHVLMTSGNVYEMVRGSVWLCNILIAHHRNWPDPVVKHGLMERFNNMLTNRNFHVRCCLLPLIGEMSTSSSIFDAFDLGFIVRLLTSETSRIDVHAILCLRRCVENHSECVGRLLELGLVDQLAKCIREGSLDAKIQSVAFLIDLSTSKDFPLLEIVVNFALLDELVHVVTHVAERLGLTILRLLWKCLRIAQNSGTVQVLAEYLEERDIRLALEEVADDQRVLIAKNARDILSELGCRYM